MTPASPNSAALVVSRVRQLRELLPGVLTATLVALAAAFVSEHYGGPLFLYALLFGMSLNFLAKENTTAPGINFASRSVLRLGVALLGARITLGSLIELGAGPVLLVIAGLLSTIAFSCLLARYLKRPQEEGLLTGGAVGICGASAALAISAALPNTESGQRMTLLTVVGVTALSTLAMILYPALATFLHLDAQSTAIFFGGTIHDVAQVVGAGYMVSEQVAQTATLVKLFRVALLVPVVFAISLAFRRRQGCEASSAPLLPGFLIGFVLLVLANSMGLLGTELPQALGSVSRWCLVIAIAALGVKTSFGELRHMGWRPVLLIVSNTIFLAMFVLIGMAMLGRL